MKTKILSLTVFLILFISNQSSAQSSSTSKPYEDGFLKRFGVAAKIGTYGPGVDFHTSLLPNLKARVGFNFMSYTYDHNIYFTAPPASGSGKDIEGTINSSKLQFPNVNLLVDYYPVKSGIFCLTAGAYIGNNKVTTLGTADGEFIIDDIAIKPKNGQFSADLRMGNYVKPYFGIGLGRTISNSRVGFRFDMGLVYQGDYVVKSDYTDAQINVTGNTTADIDLPFSQELLKLWPMMSFSISYRIQ